jgi:predicted TIM-barrel fold metal-dependent hydrolase
MGGRTSFDVFDSHQHVGGVFGIPGMGGEVGEAQFADDLKVRLEVMDRCGVRQALLMPGHSYMKPGGLADTRDTNDRLAAYQRLAPERIAVASGVVEPRHGLESLDEIDRMHGELGFKGVSWHHRQQGLPMDHPVMFACLERLATLGMVAMIHCFVGADFEEIWRLRRLAEAFPELPVLCLDSMTHAVQFEAALAAGERALNIHVDTTSSVLGPEGVRLCVERLGAERLLFGTNLYSRQAARRLGELDDVLDADISDDAKALILGGNARRIFGLEAKAG